MENEVSGEIELFSQAANNNKQPIADALEQILFPGARVLEIGSGSGQHVLHFAKELREVIWQPTDRDPYFSALERNLDRKPHYKIRKPLYLDVEHFNVSGFYDFVFCANVVHIIAKDLLPMLLCGVARLLESGGRLIIYGPFKYEGKFTALSNKEFDNWLQLRDPLSGIRDIEALLMEAKSHGFSLQMDKLMPANNQLLMLEKIDSDHQVAENFVPFA